MLIRTMYLKYFWIWKYWYVLTFYFVTCVDEWAKTAGGKDFLLAEDGHDDKIVIFGTQKSWKF